MAPSDFIPELPGGEGGVSFYHYDPYAQALAKIERGHERDLSDVRAMVDRGLGDRERLLALFAAIEPQRYRFPAIDPKSFRAAVERAVR